MIGGMDEDLNKGPRGAGDKKMTIRCTEEPQKASILMQKNP